MLFVRAVILLLSRPPRTRLRLRAEEEEIQPRPPPKTPRRPLLVPNPVRESQSPRNVQRQGLPQVAVVAVAVVPGREVNPQRKVKGLTSKRYHVTSTLQQSMEQGKVTPPCDFVVDAQAVFDAIAVHGVCTPS